jgi:hypothetical protein
MGKKAFHFLDRLQTRSVGLSRMVRPETEHLVTAVGRSKSADRDSASFSGSSHVGLAPMTVAHSIIATASNRTSGIKSLPAGERAGRATYTER